MLLHSFSTSYGASAGDQIATGPFRPLVCFLLPAFFALSGFLVAGSLVRNDLLSFGALRFLRIFPALIGEVVISALIIGPVFPILSLNQYFTNQTFYKYFLNVIGYIHYQLPGVFLGVPLNAMVNQQ